MPRCVGFYNRVWGLLGAYLFKNKGLKKIFVLFWTTLYPTQGDTASASIRYSRLYIGPAVGGFVEANLFQLQMPAIAGLVGRSQDVEGDAGQIFGCGNMFHDDGLVAGQGRQEIKYGRIALVGQESMVPGVHHQILGDGLDVGKVHHHAVFGFAGSLYNFTFERDFDNVAMPMKVAALALVVRNAMSSIEFQAAGDLHDG